MTYSRRDFLRSTPSAPASRPSRRRWPVLRGAGQSDKHGGTCASAPLRAQHHQPGGHISGAEWMATRWLYNNLTRLNVKREVVPDLAESWATSEGGRVWTFKLRRGVQFHLGVRSSLTTPCDHADILIPRRPRVPWRDRPHRGVDAIDNYAVRFTLRAPSPTSPP